MKRRHFLGYAGLVLVSCTTAQQNNTQSNSTSAKSPRQVRLSITDVQGLDLLESEYQGFRETLADTLKTNVEFFPVESYTTAAIALQNDDVELVLTGPSEYVIIRARTNAVPIIALTRPNYHSVIVVPAASGTKTLTDLKEKTIAMTSVGSTSGHLGPTYLLVKAGLNPKVDFKTEMLEDEGLSALKAGKVSAWGGGLSTYERFLEQEKLTTADLIVIAKSPPLPNDVLVASSKLNSEWIANLSDRLLSNEQAILQSLQNTDEGKYSQAQLVKANDADYDLIRDAYKAIGEGNFLS